MNSALEARAPVPKFTQAEKARAMKALEHTIALLSPAVNTSGDITSVCDSISRQQETSQRDVEKVAETTKELLTRCQSCAPAVVSETLTFCSTPSTSSRTSSTLRAPSVFRGLQNSMRPASMPVMPKQRAEMLLSSIEAARAKHATRSFSCN
eukprot:CAMPEP_0196756176 /NCGR_PEP_ID=MMETSP1091-20130531/100097_1 /TAXON_ID=302021 /ORGANISM="Rhodomonas sp., Strain CCMP768" /LENGTH=151 /DNA_ID=CAMNT_0042104745 /DNA_START=11 /DNA_END=466 /DNA_ORIENTATION=+